MRVGVSQTALLMLSLSKYEREPHSYFSPLKWFDRLTMSGQEAVSGQERCSHVRCYSEHISGIAPLSLGQAKDERGRKR